MIFLITDFGIEGPYVGQMRRVILERTPSVPVIDLISDAPLCNPRATAYLLGAYTGGYPPGTVFLSVVDPGVGSAPRVPVAVRCDARWYVGPDNGLFEIVRRRATLAETFRIEHSSEELSATFHGRDLYAPVAAELACGDESRLRLSQALRFADWPDDLAEVIYIDHFGNAMTGVRASQVAAEAVVEAKGQRLRRARTFGAVAPGEAFWYENANGLLEIAVNRGCAHRELSLQIGDRVTVACEDQ